MQTFEHEAQAKRGEPMPDGLSWSEQGAYQATALLTARYKIGSLDAEQAKKEMLEIRNAYSKSVDREKYIYHVAQLWVDIELAAMQFNKDETVENARLMRDVIYGFKRLSGEQRNKMALETA